MSDDEKKAAEAGGDKEAGEEQAQSGGSKSKLILFGGIGLSAVIIGVALALFVVRPMMAGSGDSATDAEANGHAEKTTADDGHGETADGHGADGPDGQSFVYAIQDIVVNPAGTGGSRFLSASFAFELDADHLEAAMTEKEAMVRDALITILSSKTVPQLTDPKQKEIVRYQIKKRVSKLLDTEAVANVYFTDFVLQ